jgi:hypothetical protein
MNDRDIAEINFYAKSSWLAGNRREDCATEIIRIHLKRYGIINETQLYRAINHIYDTLEMHYQFSLAAKGISHV